MDKYLYVPITLKGLMVGKTPELGWRVDTLYDFKKLENDPLGRNVTSDFSLLVNMPKGIHLHWSLPDALAHGEINNDGGMDFPCLPNRWLVTRMWTDDTESLDKIQTRSWLVQSNTLAKRCEEKEGNLGSPTRPSLIYEKKYPKYDKQPYRYLGRSLSVKAGLGDPDENDGYVERLTVIEPGNPIYTAYYPSARNIFAFYDDMTDINGSPLKNIRLCYCVSGWYNKNSDDPLEYIFSREHCIDKLGWTAPEGTIFPMLTLCHGMLLDMKWSGPDENYFSQPPQPPRAALGNTSAEALAALNAAMGATQAESERLMNHFISGNHSFEVSASDIFEAEKRLHQNKFGHVSRSNRYILSPIGNKNEPAGESALQALDNLNLSQANLERAQENLECIQQALYENWVRKVRTDDSDIIFSITDSCRLIKEKKREIAYLQNTVLQFEDKVREAVSGRFNLTRQSGQRFWKADNPVLLLSGVKRDYSHGADGRFAENGTLKARTAAISSITVEPIGDLLPKQVTINAQDLLQTDDLPYPCAKSVMGEALLLNTGFAVTIAKHLLKKAGQIPDIGVAANLAEKVKKLQTALTAALCQRGHTSQQLSSAAGMNADFPDKVAVEYWRHPWNPLYLFWECKYIADSGVIKETPDLNGWERNGYDYKYKTASKEGFERIISGHTIITPHASVLVADSARRMFGNDMETKDLAVLSQRLGGIHEQLILSGLPIQFPIVDLDSGSVYTARLVFEALEGFSPAACSFDELFSPIRAGRIVFTRIMIVDSFGQVQHVDVKNIAVGESLRPDSQIMRDTVMLPPRILQPARLNFEWLCNGTSAADSPVCGWIVPNRLETNICVFDATGDMLGYLQRVESAENPVVWKRPQAQGGGTAEPPTNINRDLYGFIMGILDISRNGKTEEKDVLTDLIGAIDKRLWNINPAAANQLDTFSFYFGRPLVVAKANVMLELMSEPCRFRQLYPNKPPKHPQVYLEKAAIPLWIGQAANHNDGAIGFFTDGKYDCFHLCGRVGETTNKKYFSQESFVYLNPKSSPDFRQITFLFDPAGELTLNSAVLPVKTVRINPEIVSAVLAKLYYTVFVAPLLTSNGMISIPYPSIEGKKWDWVGYSNDGTLKTLNDLQQADAQAGFSRFPLTAAEGWLKLRNCKNSETKRGDSTYGK